MTSTRDKILLYLIEQPDGKMIYTPHPEQVQAIKEIIDAGFDRYHAFELTFCDCFSFVKKRMLVNKYAYNFDSCV